MKKVRKIAICLALGLIAAGVLAATHPSVQAGGHSQVDRLSWRSAHGKIAMKAGGKHFPGNAKVSFARTRSDKVKGQVVDGLARNWRGRHGGTKTFREPRVFAMYDVSIMDGGRKWQPKSGEPVRVEMELDEPVSITADSSLAVAHLADDGTVEELESSRYGFTYNADKTSVTAFWFSATGFSIYTIIDVAGELQVPRRFYHFYGHSTNDCATPYIYHDQANDLINVQIVKDGDMLKEPPVPLDIVDDNGEVVSMFEGWYVISNSVRAANAVDSKLDPTNEVFEFVWPVGVTDMRLAFTNVISVTETNDWDYFVVPLYENARFLQFNENSESETEQGAGSRIIRRKLVAINDETGVAHLKVSDVEAALKNSRNEYFCGWRYMEVDGQYTNLLVYSEAGKPQDQYITVDDALFHANGGSIIPLYPYYVSAHFLHFDANARSVDFVGTLFVRSTSNFSEVEVSGNRKGYDFAGWCAGSKDEAGNVTLGERVTDADGHFIPNKTITNETGAVVFYTDAGGNIRLNEDVTLFGSWVANSSAPYRVIVWQQRVTDDKDAVDTNKTYYYVTHYISTNVSSTTQISDTLFKNFTGTRADNASVTNRNLNLSTLSGVAADNAANEDFTGFHYGRYECDDAAVASDGSTVINLYYDRDLITLRFCLYDSNQSETLYTATTATSGTLYGTEDGVNYFEVYYDNGQWYKTRVEAYDYYGKRYNRGNNTTSYYFADSYSGNYYTKNGNSYSRVTNGNYSNSTQYYGVENGTYFAIYRSANNGAWYKVQSETALYNYSGSYSGYRYTMSTSHWIVNQTMTGLYGQTLEANGYTWPQDRAWKDGYNGSSSDGTSISFLDAFLPTSGGDETFYSSASSSSSGAIIYFYKEELDGSWTLANEYHSGSSSVSFNISDKYNGFEAYQYSKSGGAWTSVGTYNANTGYYGSQVSSVSDTLEIRFKRKSYELIYKYIDDDGNGDEHTVYDTGKAVPYEAPLAGYDYAYTNSLLNWSACNITNRTFEGWYEDASLTKKFDFSATMPDGTKFLYANWAPKKHRVIVDPNGGELPENGSTWFYVNPAKDETIKEYTLTRNYRLDLHNGTYYYHYDPWDPVNDKHTDQYIPANSNATRKAYYTTNILEATDNEYSDSENRYTYDPGAYAFMGWFEVLEDGLLATDPFSFDEPPTKPVTIRALWRRLGVFTLKYESVDPDQQRPVETIFDPERHSTGNIEDGYIADAETTLVKAPTNYDKNEWLWEGWQVIDTYNNNIPMTSIRSPGDTYIVKPAHADANNVIHFRAVYKPIGDATSKHVPPVTDLILDSNENAGLAANALIATVEGRVGTYTDGTTATVSGLNQGVWFVGAQNNLSVNLADYASAFAHDNGYFLLGWDPMRAVESMIPSHYANETIGIAKAEGDENILYALWEPQIYIEFVNDTGDNLNGIQLYIPSWIEGELFRVNTMSNTYVRAAFSAFSEGTATFDLAAGETLRLVLPDAADRDFAVMGTCGYAEGSKLVVTRTEPQIAGQETIPDVVQSVYSGESYMVAGTMKVSPTPVQVKFTKTTYPPTIDVPVRYFLHNPDGTVEEITTSSGSWASYNNVKKTLEGVGASTNDIAKLLQKSATESVHEYLTSSIKEQYGYTTIGIGAATGDFDEWRSITKGEPSGGSYIRFYREKLEWSRYSLFWNDYEDAAVYVVFFKRIPVHVTIGKTVEGSEEDKSPDKKFNFSVTYTEHSVKVSYTKTITKTMQRALTSNRNSKPDLPNNNTYVGDSTDYNPDDSTSLIDWSRWETGTWSDVVESPEAPTNVKYSSDQTPDLFSARAASTETFSLPDGGRHPLEIYYSSNGEGESTGNQIRSTKYTHTFTSATQSGSRYHTTQTVTWQETVPMEVTYQYETAVVTETDLGDNYTLTRIGDNPANDSDHCSGVVDLPNRTYTISSINSNSINPVPGAATTLYDFTPLDTAIFTNTRKTGSLTVSKTVVDGEEGDTFPFTVTLGETVVDKANYTPPAGVHLGPYGKVFTFSLADGGSVTLQGLPAGASYKVEEGAHDKYVATLPANATNTVAASDTPIVVAVTNTHKTALSITIHDRDEYFTGDELHGWDISCVTGTVSVISNEAYEVTGLKNGHVLTVEHHVAAHGRAVGSYVGHFENARVTVHDALGNDVTGEYIITTTPGSLTVNGMPIIVTVTGNHETKVYNGEEQSCSGYTYVIANGLTGEAVTNDNIYIAIDHNYQTAWLRFVGRKYMTLNPSHVVVTVPEGITVSEIIVAENGWLEITPAPVTVKADDKVKILNRLDPPLTVTVTGLIGSDTIVYNPPTRVAGEAPGTYVISVSGEASQGNYTVTYETGTFTIQGLGLIQRATGSGVDVAVPVTDAMLEALGFDSQAELPSSDVAAVMNSIDPNGLRRWENLVTGMATNQLLLGVASANMSQLTLQLEPPLGDTSDLGYTVLHELRRNVNRGWTRVAGPTAGNDLTIRLLDESGQSVGASGLYKIVTLLVPNHVLSVTNELPSTNIIGVLEVNSTSTNTMTAVPWAALATDPIVPTNIVVGNYMMPAQLAPGDTLHAITAGGVYQKYTIDASGAWTSSVATVTLTKDGSSSITETPPAEARELQRGNAVWITRNNPSTPYFLIGQYTGADIQIPMQGSDGTTVVPTMIANPRFTPLAINDINWGGNPTTSDVIWIPTENKVPTVLMWKRDPADGKMKWGVLAQDRATRKSVLKSNWTIPAGTGFWYNRKGAAFTVTIPVDKVSE